MESNGKECIKIAASKKKKSKLKKLHLKESVRNSFLKAIKIYF